jgi:hypothetical protein
MGGMTISSTSGLGEPQNPVTDKTVFQDLSAPCFQPSAVVAKEAASKSLAFRSNQL